MDIVDPAIEDYLLSLLPQREPVVAEMEALAEKIHFPIVGPLVGRLLYQLTLVHHAERIAELGSGFGYSAYWFAKGLPKTGKVICTEGSADRIRQGTDFLRRAGLDQQVEFRQGDALNLMTETDGPFDIIFCDIDKESYPDALSIGLPLLRSGGLFIADNVLWSGRVAASSEDPDTVGIQTFNHAIFSPELTTTIIPLRDGVSVSLKR
ncbi:MAG: O-methyltransferase [Candidatus Manganitrophus sp.]|nr:MAG: O-methyltransferase [Candidatus Manganitrophus sp.]WDT82243.1 MAG: O-methyltransferase [Candidatus Manganitrophus sp.]